MDRREEIWQITKIKIYLKYQQFRSRLNGTVDISNDFSMFGITYIHKASTLSLSGAEARIFCENKLDAKLLMLLLP